MFDSIKKHPFFQSILGAIVSGGVMGLILGLLFTLCCLLCSCTCTTIRIDSEDNYTGRHVQRQPSIQLNKDTTGSTVSAEAKMEKPVP